MAKCYQRLIRKIIRSSALMLAFTMILTGLPVFTGVADECNHDYRYRQYTKVDDTYHIVTCGICGKELGQQIHSAKTIHKLEWDGDLCLWGKYTCVLCGEIYYRYFTDLAASTEDRPDPQNRENRPDIQQEEQKPNQSMNAVPGPSPSPSLPPKPEKDMPDQANKCPDDGRHTGALLNISYIDNAHHEWTCSNCGETVIEEHSLIDASPSNFRCENSTEHSYTCYVCNATVYQNHSFDESGVCCYCEYEKENNPGKAPQPDPSNQGNMEGWKAAYYQYLVGNDFKKQQISVDSEWCTCYRDSFGVEYYVYVEEGYWDYQDDFIRFALYDLNQDGTPELFAYDGTVSKLGGCFYAYTYRDGRMVYLGIAGYGNWRNLIPYRDDHYSILLSEVDDSMYATVYYSCMNDQGQLQLVTLTDYCAPDFEPYEITYTVEPIDQSLYDTYYSYYRDNADMQLKFWYVLRDEIVDDAWWNDFLTKAYNASSGRNGGTSNPSGPTAPPEKQEPVAEKEPVSYSDNALFYAKTTKETRVRETPSKKGQLLLTLPEDAEVAVLDTRTGSDEYIWYRIDDGRGNIGYARSDFFVKKTEKPVSYDGSIYGLAIQKLATRSGPSKRYKDMGTYFVKGQYIKVLCRAYDSSQNSWWVKCEIPYHETIRTLWTDYYRFDAKTLPLENIPIGN